MTETVYITSGNRSNSRTAHIDEECPYLYRASSIFEKDADLVDENEYCKFCIGKKPGGSGHPTRSTCPFCDESFQKSLADHLDICEAAPRDTILTDGGTPNDMADGTPADPIQYILGEEDRATISYIPSGGDEPGAWKLIVASTEMGRVELLLDQDAMYELWTEVQHTPWPREPVERDRLRAKLVELAMGADVEHLRAALDAIADDPEVIPDT